MVTSTVGAVILASVLACLVTTVGIYIISKYEAWGDRNVVYFISFAAGVLISVSFTRYRTNAQNRTAKCAKAAKKTLKTWRTWHLGGKKSKMYGREYLSFTSSQSQSK